MVPKVLCWLRIDFTPMHFPRFGLSRNTEFETLKLKLFLKMLRQYQLNGGIRRPQPRFGQSKRFGTTTTMAAPAAPTPWNRLPPLLNDFRWWDDIFLKFSLLESSDETPTAHKKNLAEPHHGKHTRY